MRKLAVTALVIVGIIGLSGCASTKIIAPEVQMAVKSKLPPIEQNQAQVCFIREGSMMAITWNPDIKEDGKKIGTIANSSYVCHNTTAGQHQYIVDAVLDKNRKIDITLKPEARGYIQYSIHMGLVTGNGKLEILDEPMGLSKINDISK